jgi:hypothetical protein
VKLARKWRVLMLLALVGVLSVGGYLIFREHLPEYKGKSVSYWFRQYCQPSDHGAPRGAYDAFYAMGTNALPYLVGQALSKSTDTALRTNFFALLERLPDSWDLPKFVSHDDFRRCALQLVDQIDPPAETALVLVKEALNSESPLRHHQALEILSNVKTNAAVLAPYFGRALRVDDRDAELESKSLALRALVALGGNAEPALQDLIWTLNTEVVSNENFLQVANCLGNIGAAARAAVPKLLTEFQSETNLERRCSLAGALFRVDSSQDEALESLIETLNASDDFTCFYPGPVSWGRFNSLCLHESHPASYAADQLAVIGPIAGAAIPALVEALNGTNVGIWRGAADALRKIGAPHELYLPKLEERLASESSGIQLVVSVILLDVDPSNFKAQSFLAAQIMSHSRLEKAALALIYQKVVSATGDVKEALREVLKCEDEMSRIFARGALQKIEREERK